LQGIHDMSNILRWFFYNLVRGFSKNHSAQHHAKSARKSPETIRSNRTLRL
jgi:hypothetical protein